MRRPVHFRLSTTLAAFVFLAMAGVPGPEIHPGPHHAPNPLSLASQIGHDHTLAKIRGAAATPTAPSDPAAPDGSGAPPHATKDGQASPDRHAEHGSAHHPQEDTEKCTCVSACQGGSGPPTVEAVASAMPDSGPVRIRRAPPADILAAAGRIPYLIPFSNPPPFLT